jgi:hypothetical protein
MHPIGMSAKEYQNAYHAALFALEKKYKVGQPYRENGGNRVCVVDSMIATDHTVFLLAWGVNKANEIKIDGTQPASVSTSPKGTAQNLADAQIELLPDWAKA